MRDLRRILSRQVTVYTRKQPLQSFPQSTQYDDASNRYEADEQTVLKHGCAALITYETSYYFGQNGSKHLSQLLHVKFIMTCALEPTGQLFTCPDAEPIERSLCRSMVFQRKFVRFGWTVVFVRTRP
jgi:hypothetical protein